MKKYLVKTKTTNDTFYVYLNEKLDIYVSIIDKKFYYKDDIIIIREL